MNDIFRRKTGLVSILILTISQASWAERPVRGTYSVPVSDPALKSAAEFPVKFKADTYQTDPNRLAFPLPTELTGAPQTVTLDKVAGTDNQWAGPQGTALCSQSDRTFSCQIQFQSLAIDASQVKDAITAIYPDLTAASLRMEVADRFARELQGVIQYQLRGGNTDQGLGLDDSRSGH